MNPRLVTVKRKGRMRKAHSPPKGRMHKVHSPPKGRMRQAHSPPKGRMRKAHSPPHKKREKTQGDADLDAAERAVEIVGVVARGVDAGVCGEVGEDARDRFFVVEEVGGGGDLVGGGGCGGECVEDARLDGENF